MVKKQERMYSEKQLEIKRDLGKALAMLNETIKLQMATVSHKTRMELPITNQQVQALVPASSDWLAGRVTRATLLEHLFKANEKLGKKVEAEYGKLLKILYPDKPPAEEKKG